MKKIVIIAGGSGGHVIPGLSIYDHLKKISKISIVTDHRGAKFINKEHYQFSLIDVPNMYSNIFLFPFKIFKFIISIIKSILFFKKEKFDILISTGGYMSVPFCIAAYILNLKIILFEPNTVLGRSNKFMLKFCKKIICYHQNIKLYPKKYQNKKYILDPILRKDIYSIKKNEKNEIPDLKKILIIGGSQGSKFLDENIVKLIIKVSETFRIKLYQQVFDQNKKNLIKKKYDEINIESKLFNFDNNIYEIYNDIDLAITRSGASAIAELSYFNIPFIAIPFPYSKDNHQYYNAEAYVKEECCWLINQNEYKIQNLNDLIIKLFTEKEEYLQKKNNLLKKTNQNTWNNINKKLIELINEN